MNRNKIFSTLLSIGEAYSFGLSQERDRKERPRSHSVMGKYRVHASPIQAQGERTPFLTIEALPDDKVRFDFESMVSRHGDAEPAVVLPMSSVYQLLEGQEITVQAGPATVKMSPRSGEIIIDCTESMNNNVSQYRVSTSEIALAWNMIQGRHYG